MADEPANGTEPDTRTPFEKFEQLTKRLVSVPKAEVDEAERKRVKRSRKRASA